MGGRADIYVGFYEVGLRNLRPGGRLGFICADRWMRNQYGRNLRRMITSGYSMDVVLTMHDVDAFDEQVSAYPAITIVRRGDQGPAVAADTTSGFGPEQASDLRTWIDTSVGGPLVQRPGFEAARLPHWFSGEDSWPAASPARLAVLKQLSERFRPLEDATTGTRVGIGVATGADDIFITHQSDLADVETDRLLPLTMVRDTSSGRFHWHGTYLVNPWNSQGELVELVDYPRLARHFERNRGILRGRHTARQRPDRWYKTIDKVNLQLTAKPKLLFPDLKLTSQPVLDPGGYYPHHNLYYVISDTWDLRVLGGLLLSKVAEAFVAAYAVRMRGGTLRFQAQYLRKIRIPDAATISESDATTLADAFDSRDVDSATQVALRIYGLAELPE